MIGTPGLTTEEGGTPTFEASGYFRSVVTGKPFDAWEETRRLSGSQTEIHALYASIGYSAYVDTTAHKLLARLKQQQAHPDGLIVRAVLDELQRLIEASPQPTDAKKELQVAFDDVRADLDRGGSVDQSLSLLEEDISRHVRNVDDDEAATKKLQIDSVLRSLIYARHSYRPEEPSFTEVVREAARRYLDSPWMHGPWLSWFLLKHLCDGELARHVPAKPFERAGDFHAVGPLILFGSGLALRGLAAVLDLPFLASLSRFLVYLAGGWIAAIVIYVLTFDWRHRKVHLLALHLEPVRQGGFDGRETARRLRDLEQKGIFVDSLMYPLLEMQPHPACIDDF